MLAKMPQKNFCILPWVHLHVSNQGRPYPCCQTSGIASPATNGCGKSISIDSKNSISSARNSREMRELRLAFLNGEQPEICSSCFDAEKRGQFSLRKGKNLRYFDYIDSAIKNTSEDGAISTPLLSADFRLGNICNLRCRMCSSSSSKLLLEEERILGHIANGDNNEGNYPWFEDDSFWVSLFESQPELRSVEFAGGEPLLSKRFYWIVDWLIESGRSSEMILSLHSNTTTLPNGFLQKLEKFRGIEFMVSLDGTERINSYIRYPSHWPTIIKNMESLNDWATYPFRSVSVHATIQAYNAQNLISLIRFIMKYENFDVPVFLQLTEPSALSFLSLPGVMRKNIAEKLIDFLENLKEEELPPRWSKHSVEKFQKNILALVAGLQSVKEQDIEPFLRRTKQQDKFRGHNIADFIPELSVLFSY